MVNARLRLDRAKHQQSETGFFAKICCSHRQIHKNPVSLASVRPGLWQWQRPGDRSTLPQNFYNNLVDPLNLNAI
ncbi:MAG: hypothetical protein HC849_19385 [Oscillatoriales cyanobacterium RU_3_3]|nr:hypothetical protein [Oscillatoriales cyanobacterium RU_3_3]NJR25337.1 hypothetical protein [Richelia sp. CSU_2_1]